MGREILIFTLAVVGVFIIDQNIKSIFLSGFVWESECISLILALNKGVAFSMLEFMGEYLKYMQLGVLTIIFAIFVKDKNIFVEYALSGGLLGGGAVGNLYDRFAHGAVVDYVYWHCGFDFAIFNFADVMIDLAIVLILWKSFIGKKKVC